MATLGVSGFGPWSPFGRAAERLNPTPDPYADKPVQWARDKLREFMWSKEREIAEALQTHRYVAVKSSHDTGKALAVDTPIPTPNGWTTMGALVVGSRVYAPTGLLCRVVDASPVWTNQDCYEVEFEDGAVIVASGNHLWNMTTMNARGNRRGDVGRVTDWRDHWDITKTMTTEEWVRLLRTSSGQRNLAVPTTLPLEGTEWSLPIPPYTLGVWLGDGTSIRYEATLNLNDADEIIEGLESEGTSIRLRRDAPESGSCLVRWRGGQKLLVSTGLYHDKHIPAAALRANRADRESLLAGLLDTDGSAGRDNALAIDLCNERLADDVAELVRTFGWKAWRGYREITMDSGTIVPCWRLNFTPTYPVVRLARRNTYRPEQRGDSRHTQRTVVDIRPVDSTPVRCITVDSDDGLFLAGIDFVPTHNSYTASRVVAHFIDTNPDGEAFAVTTAPTDPQVKAILWREIGRAHRKGNLKGRITLEAQWKLSFGMGPDELVAYGRKPADYAAVGFSGIHAGRVLVVIDEAGGVTRGLFDAVDTLVTNEDSRVLAIGNPDDPSTHFAKVCQPGSGWYVIHIDGLESPNFTKEEVAKYPDLQRYMIAEGIAPSAEEVPDTIRPLLLSPLWVAERLRRWGKASPLFVSKVRGNFPQVGEHTLIEPRWVTAACNRDVAPDEMDPRLGVDVARYGEDFSIFGLRLGRWFRVVKSIAKGPTTQVSGEIIRIGTALRKQPIANVDDTGVGGGVTDELVQARYPVLPLIGGTASTQLLPNGKPRFVNARSEWWWNLREAMAGITGTGEDGWLDLDPDDEDLQADLVGIRYEINQFGQIKVESKDDMRRRGMSSPDRGDALAYSLVTQAHIPEAMTEYMITGDLLTKAW